MIVGRRNFIRNTFFNIVGFYLFPNSLKAFTSVGNYKIAVCDWMLLKRQDIEAIQLASKIGADGIELDIGGLGHGQDFKNKLINPIICQQFIDEAKLLGIQFCSLAMSAFYAQSFSDRDNSVSLVFECIDTMQNMNIKIGFLPLGIHDDLIKYPEKIKTIVKKLKLIAKYAEKADVIIGVETTLSAFDQIKFFDMISSPNIKCYYNFENSVKYHRNVCEEIEILGKDRVCQIHCTDKDGVLLKDDPFLDMKKIKHTLDKINWKGWLVIERSRDPRFNDIYKSYLENVNYLKSIFQ